MPMYPIGYILAPRYTCANARYSGECNCTLPIYAADGTMILRTDAPHGYRMIVRAGPTDFDTIRTWQARSGRAARAYQAHFYPNEKILNVRRAGRRENYLPAQVVATNYGQLPLPTVERRDY